MTAIKGMVSRREVRELLRQTEAIRKAETGVHTPDWYEGCIWALKKLLREV